MSMQFNAWEVYGMGVRIEENGKAFYDEAARRTAETALREFFRELAVWEGQHIELFRGLRDALPSGAREESLFDPDSEMGDYLAAMADSHVFLRNADIPAMVAACRGPAEILDLAMSFEKDSVVFYATMRKVVSDRAGRETIERLIDEELGHVALLSRRKAKPGARS
jgi:rubrerythrin